MKSLEERQADRERRKMTEAELAELPAETEAKADKKGKRGKLGDDQAGGNGGGTGRGAGWGA